MADCIPFGQPILVGHHSEKGDRRFRARMSRKYEKSITLYKASEEAEYQASRVGRSGISSDDPEAIQKLREKLENLEDQQKLMKEINAAHKRFMKNPASLDASPLSDHWKEKIRTYKPTYSWEPHPFAPFELTNNNANIRRIMERIHDLERKAERARQQDAPKEITHSGFTIREDHDENRIMILFPGKPEPDSREILKRNGFKWSPTRGAWVRMLNASGQWAAEKVALALNKQKTA